MPDSKPGSTWVEPYSPATFTAALDEIAHGQRCAWFSGFFWGGIFFWLPIGMLLMLLVLGQPVADQIKFFGVEGGPNKLSEGVEERK